MNTKNVNSIGINEGGNSLVWNVNHSYLRDCETNIPCHNFNPNGLDIAQTQMTKMKTNNQNENK